MDDSRWDDITGRIKDTFEVEEEFDEALPEGPGKRDGLVFAGPLGRMKLERTSRPRVIGSHGITAKRIGAHASVAYEYDSSDIIQSVKLFRWSDGGWVPVNDPGSMLA